MTEPGSSTAGSVAIATGAITITGTFLGLQFDALLLGLFGGLVSLMHLPAMSRWRMAGALATAAVLGALFSPIVIAGGLNYLPWLKAVGPDVLRLGAAAAIGLVAQVGIQAALTFIRRKGEA